MIEENEGDLDGFDRRMIEELSSNGRMPVTALAERVGLTKTPCQKRLKRLIDSGVIAGSERWSIRAASGGSMSPLSRSS